MTDTTTDQDAASGVRRIQLDVTGMTCGMCSSRVAKRLNRVDGVVASVDLASKVATIDADDGVSVADLCAVVQKAGYGATEHVGGLVDVASPTVHGVRSPMRSLIELIRRFFGLLGMR
ncbi:heavy-metal-associated domain-containing protein [Mycolicibacterium sp. CH28]|uniref:heavy-metal-associated domain-containing protein n=1 Tax=Mycolicibacterium sp. CH28 TaxID=2512237 RepID=UPI0010812599|nr:heavy metal-associated domain-containing protein [Mycolicibacterium sp. CH28]TGD84432.1 heavy-metal-associated domain-containing protein [Mycolicibacterium sp. CH28]